MPPTLKIAGFVDVALDDVSGWSSDANACHVVTGGSRLLQHVVENLPQSVQLLRRDRVARR